jgi:AbrB family looped-hinge helix DNA binding protein
MKTAIVTTMDLAGRLVIPKAVREAAELKPGVRLFFEVVDGRIQIAPEPRDVRIERRGKLKVAVPVSPAEPLQATTVRKTLEATRSGRGSSR